MFMVHILNYLSLYEMINKIIASKSWCVFFNPKKPGGMRNQDTAHSITCHFVCSEVTSVKLDVYVLYHLVNT